MSIIVEGSALATNVKTSLTAVEEAIAALPAGPEKDAVTNAIKVHHDWLWRAAKFTANFFRTPVTAFSGGTEKGG